MTDPLVLAKRQLNERCLHLIEPQVAKILSALVDEVEAHREQNAQRGMELADIASHERWSL